jgi:hypothetical protein
VRVHTAKMAPATNTCTDGQTILENTDRNNRLS